MTIEQLKALVNEMVVEGTLIVTVAHAIDWARFEDENLRASLEEILIYLRGQK